MEQRAEPSIVVNAPPAQRNLLDELQGIDMTAPAFPHPPQQALQLQGVAGLSELVASAAQAQADKQALPSGKIPLAAAAGKEGSVATASIFSKALSHTQPQGSGSLSTPSVWSSASMNVINLGDLTATGER